jgi:hypothetical protein
MPLVGLGVIVHLPLTRRYVTFPITMLSPLTTSLLIHHVDYVDPRRPLNWMLALAQNCASKSNNRTLNTPQPFDLGVTGFNGGSGKQDGANGVGIPAALIVGADTAIVPVP